MWSAEAEAEKRQEAEDNKGRSGRTVIAAAAINASAALRGTAHSGRSAISMLQRHGLYPEQLSCQRRWAL